MLLPAAVKVGLYWYGRVHTAEYETSLFGQRGSDVRMLKAQLKAQLGSALLVLQL
ncbi:DUF6529 family protein [Streptomyces sp. NPDC003753]